MSDSIPRLPPEMLCHILQSITDPFDLAQVCSTSKQLYHAATPALYRDITIDIGALLNTERLHVPYYPNVYRHERLQFTAALREAPQLQHLSVGDADNEAAGGAEPLFTYDWLPPRPLKSLRLISTGYSSISSRIEWPFDFTKLEHVDLHQCFGVSETLSSLCDLYESTPANLRSFSFVSGDDDLSSCISLLGRLAHASPKLLSLDVIYHRDWHDEPWSMHLLLDRPSALTKLALLPGTYKALPVVHEDLSMISDYHRDLRDLMISIPISNLSPPGTTNVFDQLTPYIDTIVALPKLDTVTLVNMPVACGDVYPKGFGNKDQYAEALQPYGIVDFVEEDTAWYYMALLDDWVRAFANQINCRRLKLELPPLRTLSIGSKHSDFSANDGVGNVINVGPATYAISPSRKPFGHPVTEPSAKPVADIGVVPYQIRRTSSTVNQVIHM
ncbi:hypothetical protein B0A48_15591 [Cryoendolithus antarcticus]|uniref:F-box domain-containing protein n=1 Tax=Cryoendolithus antarcticus TaxID=1507870 RepID=A0A1V8SGM6_9PEZI|nr:hypothetical protein B0A48_15591 [Cryoendolithus antarcticus]